MLSRRSTPVQTGNVPTHSRGAPVVHQIAVMALLASSSSHHNTGGQSLQQANSFLPRREETRSASSMEDIENMLNVENMLDGENIPAGQRARKARRVSLTEPRCSKAGCSKADCSKADCSNGSSTPETTLDDLEPPQGLDPTQAPSPNHEPNLDRNPNPSPNPNPNPDPNQVSMAKPEDTPPLHDGDSDDDSDDDCEVGARHTASKKCASPTPSRSSERKKRAGPAITLGATGPLLREVGYQAARDDATMPAASSLGTGGEPAPFAWPRRVHRVLSAEARAANFKKNAVAVKKLRELCRRHNYNLPPEENAALDRRDADGNVSCTLIVNGFPVNGDHPWLDGCGGGLARSVQHVVNVPHLGATLAAWPPGTHSFGPGLLYARRSGNPSYPDPSTVVSQSR